LKRLLDDKRRRTTKKEPGLLLTYGMERQPVLGFVILWLKRELRRA